MYSCALSATQGRSAIWLYVMASRPAPCRANGRRPSGRRQRRRSQRPQTDALRTFLASTALVRRSSRALASCFRFLSSVSGTSWVDMTGTSVSAIQCSPFSACRASARRMQPGSRPSDVAGANPVAVSSARPPRPAPSSFRVLRRLRPTSARAPRALALHGRSEARLCATPVRADFVRRARPSSVEPALTGSSVDARQPRRDSLKVRAVGHVSDGEPEGTLQSLPRDVRDLRGRPVHSRDAARDFVGQTSEPLRELRRSRWRGHASLRQHALRLCSPAPRDVPRHRRRVCALFPRSRAAASLCSNAPQP